MGSLGAQVSMVKERSPVGCNYVCFLYSGGDDWESDVFIVKRAPNIKSGKAETKRKVKSQ